MGAESDKGPLGELLGAMSKEMERVERDYLMPSEIKFPIEVNEVEFPRLDPQIRGIGAKFGEMVMIRPCAEEYEHKTYLGMYIGKLPIDYFFVLEKKTKKLEVVPHTNPAIYVFKLKKIIYGCESWWGPIESEDQLRRITDEEIESIWYVKMFKAMHGVKERSDEEEKVT